MPSRELETTARELDGFGAVERWQIKLDMGLPCCRMKLVAMV